MGAFILSVTVRNRPGVLARISNVFASSGTNIDGMSMGRASSTNLSKLRIEACLNDGQLEVLTGNLHEIQDVVRIETMQSRSKAFAYWSAAYGLFVAVMGLNVVSPIYALYKVQWGLSSGMLTLAFTAYAMAVIPSIVVFGQLSDRGGFRRMLVPGAVVALAGSICLALATGLPMLLLARVLQGLSVGMFNGAAVSILTKLHPKQDHRRAALLGAVAVTAGNALGPLLSGLLAEFAPMPTRLPYLVHIAFIVPGLLCLLLSRGEIPASQSSRLHWPKLPREPRPPFIVAALSSFIAWGITSLFGSVIPMYLNVWIGSTGPALSGTMVAAVLLLSAVSQIMCRKWPLRSIAKFGIVMIGIGLVTLVLTIHTGSMALLVASMLFVGAGYGPLYAGSLALVNEIAPGRSRGDTVSSFYVCTYMGVVGPVLGLGIMAQHYGLRSAFDLFALVLGGLLAVSLAGWNRLNLWNKTV